MASTSGPAGSSTAAAYGRMKTAATTMTNDNQSLITEILKTVNLMKEIAVDLEKDDKSEMVKELEAGVIQLLEASDDCGHLSNAIHSVGNSYQPGPEPRNFKKLLDDEIAKSKANSSSTLQNHPRLRQFKEAIWNVHHSGQPMPGEEQEDIVMTSTQGNILNFKCPITGKPVTELAEPVRSMDCKHVYEKKAIMHCMRSTNYRCPVAGCPRILQAQRVVCDPLLLVEIDELRTMSKQFAQPETVEDWTALDEEESSE